MADDPRTHPQPGMPTLGLKLAESLDQLGDLHRLCKEGRAYEVEEWIRAGRLAQLAPNARFKTADICFGSELIGR